MLLLDSLLQLDYLLLPLIFHVPALVIYTLKHGVLGWLVVRHCGLLSTARNDAKHLLDALS